MSVILDQEKFKEDVLKSLSVKELSDKYNINQVAVKAAIKQLRGEGILPKRIVKKSNFTFVVNKSDSIPPKDEDQVELVDVDERVDSDPFAN